ncbi:hypothetical protein [Microcella frigidaquae]|uniref:Uncharacterized protein n=1 Tax=Microcella frigidaquae TaxID=424758 RepID=A0A840XLX9_9MICO|nr:hypothetical protein [Microcella frigidaquae]MBB5617618.1 hypothetical protein [Microcella frigidaquae]NHN45933.1 hypothetical protein [Microcella frigidaquae]
MQKTAKVAAGSAAALAILIAGGVALAMPAQAAPAGKSVSVVEPTDATDSDNVQDEVEDGTDDGTEVEDGAEVEDGTDDGEIADDNEGSDESETEDTSDDINGVEVEDGHQD